MQKQQVISHPLISVIIPIYNAASFLPQTIESALSQDYPNLEILLLNDGSTDQSKQICESYIAKYQNTKNKNHTKNNHHIRFFNLPHQGVSRTRNYGLSKFSGKYFCFLDADDLLAPTFISDLYYFATEHQLKYVSSTYQRRIYSSDQKTPLTEKAPLPPSSSFPYKIISTSDFLEKLLDLETGYNFCHMKLFHHSLKSTLFDPDLKVAEDALYNFTILKNFDQVGILEKPLYIYQVHQHSTVRSFTKDYAENYHHALQKISTYLHFQYPDLFPRLEKSLQAFIATHLFFILVNFCCHQQNQHPRKTLRTLYNIPLFYRAIYLAPLRFFSPPKAFILFCFKFRLFLILQLIGRLRAKQNTSK